jgi:hypothetical protein
MGSTLGLTKIHRQNRLRTLQRLDLGFFVDREHDGVRRRRDVESNHIPDLGDELRVGRQLERLGAVGLQSERPPDAADHRVTDAGRLGHRSRAPMGLARRRGLKRLHDYRLHRLVGDRARRADARFVIQPRQAMRDELAPPLGDRRLGRAKALGDGRIRCIGARQHDPGSEGHRPIHADAFRQAH